jgi:enolase-phosphatase E1
MQEREPSPNAGSVMATHGNHPSHAREEISHLLLDIEGTTCPVSFVAGMLFPYASAQLGSYLRDHGHEPAVLELLKSVLHSWCRDPDAEAKDLLSDYGGLEAVGTDHLQALESYLQLLIRCDRKVTALKDLQGMIWRHGYESGRLKAPLFDDVPEALSRWSGQGKVLAVYSSGSVTAQKLLYGHTQAGDLTSLFHHWFDTRIGAKTESESYMRIATAMNCDRAAVLFISDSPSELKAACEAGMAVLFSDRPGNPERDSGNFEPISNYADLSFHGSS